MEVIRCLLSIIISQIFRKLATVSGDSYPLPNRWEENFIQRNI